MAFGDFVALKRRLSIEQTAVLLGLNTKPTGRPVQTARKAASVRSSSRWRKELFYCFPGKKGGDAIELVCHVKGVSQKGRRGLDLRRKVPWYYTPSSLTAFALSSSRSRLRSRMNERATQHNSTVPPGELFLWTDAHMDPRAE